MTYEDTGEFYRHPHPVRVSYTMRRYVVTCALTGEALSQGYETSEEAEAFADRVIVTGEEPPAPPSNTGFGLALEYTRRNTSKEDK